MNSAKPQLGLIGFGAFGRLTAKHQAPWFDILAHDPAVTDDEGLARLTTLEEAAACPVVVLAVPVGVLAETVAAFAPHLTLGRIGRLKNARAFGATLANLPVGDLPAQAVRELVLYESAAGRYVPLATWPLGRKTLGSRSGIARKRGRAMTEPQPQLIGPPPNVL